jgi:predicted transcriptional regulator
MPRKPQDVTDAELAVLQLLWKNGSATIREMTSQLYPGGSASDYATVKKLLSRLETKSCVRRDRSESIHIFEAAIERGDLIGQRLIAMAASLCDGCFTPLLTHLVEARALTPEELKSLHKLIDKLDEDFGKDNRQG